MARLGRRPWWLMWSAGASSMSWSALLPGERVAFSVYTSA